jgi:hypothetical protein
MNEFVSCQKKKNPVPMEGMRTAATIAEARMHQSKASVLASSIRE